MFTVVLLLLLLFFFVGKKLNELFAEVPPHVVVVVGVQTGDRPPQWMQLRTQCVNGVFNQTVIKLDYFFPLCFLSEAALGSVHLQFLPTCYPSGRKKFTRNFFFFRQPDVPDGPDVPDVCLFIHEMFFFLLWAKIFIGHFRGVGIKKTQTKTHE